jgi:hypothetical protein
MARRLWLVAAIMAAANLAILGASRNALAGESRECESAKTCMSNKCSGECVNGTRTNCFCCSGLCWRCGDSC